MDKEIIPRRTALKHLGVLTGTVAGQGLLGRLPADAAAPASDMTGTPEAPAQEPSAPQFFSSTPQFFKPEEFQTVELLTEMIIPTDEEPGAREAQVANYIDFMVCAAAEYKPELQREWTSGLALLDQLSREKYGRPFREVPAADRERLLTEMSLPERDPKANHRGFAFYKLVKEMTIHGFYTSRVGLVGVLRYQGRQYLTAFPGCTDCSISPKCG